MSARPSPLGYGLYFIDVLACLLFCLTLALVGARFGSEHTVAVDLPGLTPRANSGSGLSAPSITLRSEGGSPQVYWQGEPVTLQGLADRLESAPPPSVVLRSEESLLARVIAIAHASGVRDIQFAYESEGREPGP